MFCLQRLWDYDFVVAWMFYSGYLLNLKCLNILTAICRILCHVYNLNGIVLRSTCMCIHGWCSRCSQPKYLWLFTHWGRENRPMALTQAQHYCFYIYLFWGGILRPNSNLYHATNTYIPQWPIGHLYEAEKSSYLAFMIHCMLFPLFLEFCA